MKSFLKSVLLLVLASAIFSVQAVDAPKKSASAPSVTAKVAVYYFHYTRRCATCQAVESETRKALSALYPSAFASGKVTFRSVNLDEKAGQTLAEKNKVGGQSLLVVGAGKRMDLTDVAFLYARSKPDRLRTELKKVVEPLLN
jgi:hypothetical protein